MTPNWLWCANASKPGGFAGTSPGHWRPPPRPAVSLGRSSCTDAHKRSLCVCVAMATQTHRDPSCDLFLGKRALAAVHDSDELLHHVVGLLRAIERRQVHWRPETLTRDRLRVGELLEPIGTMDATETRISHTAERQRRDTRERDDGVDRRHTGANAAGEFGSALLRENRRSEAVAGRVRTSDRIVHVFHRVDRQRRAERLVGDRTRVLGHVGQNDWLYETLADGIRPAEDRGRALGDGVVDVARDDPDLRWHRDRADLGAGVRTGTQAPGLLHDLLDETVVNQFMHVHTLDADTSLSGVGHALSL